ncbi:hypothetical protein PGB90_008025 [Kerria lacca]
MYKKINHKNLPVIFKFLISFRFLNLVSQPPLALNLSEPPMSAFNCFAFCCKIGPVIGLPFLKAFTNHELTALSLSLVSGFLFTLIVFPRFS